MCTFFKYLAPTSSVVFYRTPEPSTFPGPPTKPEVTDIKENSVRLRWKPNANHGASPVHSYTVEYVSHETGEVTHVFLNKVNKGLVILAS